MKKQLAALLLATTLTAGIGIAVPTSAQAASTAEIVSSVNFREGASTSAKSIRFLKKGETVDLISKVNDYWYKVRDSKGQTGYVSTSSQYIKVNASSSGGSSSGGSSNSSSKAEIISGVNFREGASTSSKSIRLLKKGEIVDLISKVNDYWYKVRDSKGQTGYVSTDSKYIKVSSSGSGSGGSSSGGSSNNNSGGSSNSGSSNTSALVNKIISAGKKYLGTPYEYGSDRSNTKTFDCSDFVRQAFKDGAGITLPSDSRSQGDYVKDIGKTSTDWHNLKPGDLMFFMDYKGTSKSAYPKDKSNQRISHVAIYLGDGKILSTYSKESGGVRIDDFAGKHWEYRFIFGGSALK
ncbi:SH3 domain-containing protein [Paenibacillus sp. TAB 01]|uniref:C40 family peptidase n=1 Tax=Paenibacillus sp. TAB 01 TaxID=3368988 RepID=UPI00374FEBF1